MNLKQILNNITETKTTWHPSEDAIDKYAEATGKSWGQAEKDLIAQHKEHEKYKGKSQEEIEDIITKSIYGNDKVKVITDKQFNKMCKDVAKDWHSDNKGTDASLDDAAYDLADSMLYDPKVKEYVKKHLGKTYNAQVARAFIADNIA